MPAEIGPESPLLSHSARPGGQRSGLRHRWWPHQPVGPRRVFLSAIVTRAVQADRARPRARQSLHQARGDSVMSEIGATLAAL